MFNRQNFNRGKFNISDTTQTVSGAASLSLLGTVAGFLSIQAPPTTAAMDFDVNGNPTRNLVPPSTTVRLATNSIGQYKVRLLGNSAPAVLELAVNGEVTRRIFTDILAELSLGVNGKNTRLLFGNAPTARLRMNVTAPGSRIIRGVAPIAAIILNSGGMGKRIFFASSPDIKLSLELTGWADMYGYAIFELEDLILPIGGELLIDTGQMTVTLNGQDVTRYVGRNSEFFKLRPGDNIILYEDGVENRAISYNILWKDLWL